MSTLRDDIPNVDQNILRGGILNALEELPS